MSRNSRYKRGRNPKSSRRRDGVLRRGGRSRADLKLVEYEVSDEPQTSRDDDALTPEDRERLSFIGQRVVGRDRPERYVEELKQLVGKYPHHRQAHNYLTVAYEAAGQIDKAREMVRLTYERFPKYLFAVTNHCHALMREGRTDEIPGVLNNNFAIDRFCDGRKRFHPTEFVAWHIMVVHYCLATRKLEEAMASLDVAHQAWPDHPEVMRLRTMLRGFFQDALRQILPVLDPEETSGLRRFARLRA